jgi:cbb3-type cytochrome oxidase subunit 3
MLGLITGAVMGLCFFLVSLWAYRRGIKDGQALKDNLPLPDIKTPAKAVSEVVGHIEHRQESKKVQAENAKVNQYLQNLLSFDGTKQTEIVDE